MQRRLIDFNLPELEALTMAMPERYRLMILLASWCGLRFGEITELRRHDVDLTDGVVNIRRAVVRVDGEFIIGTPKTDAGRAMFRFRRTFSPS